MRPTMRLTIMKTLEFQTVSHSGCQTNLLTLLLTYSLTYLFFVGDSHLYVLSPMNLNLGPTRRMS